MPQGSKGPKEQQLLDTYYYYYSYWDFCEYRRLLWCITRILHIMGVTSRSTAYERKCSTLSTNLPWRNNSILIIVGNNNIGVSTWRCLVRAYLVGSNYGRNFGWTITSVSMQFLAKSLQGPATSLNSVIIPSQEQLILRFIYFTNSTVTIRPKPVSTLEHFSHRKAI